MRSSEPRLPRLHRLKPRFQKDLRIADLREHQSAALRLTAGSRK